MHSFIVCAGTYNYVEAVEAVEVQSRTINTYINIYLEAVKGGHTFFKVCARIKRRFLSNVNILIVRAYTPHFVSTILFKDATCSLVITVSSIPSSFSFYIYSLVFAIETRVVISK